MAYMTKEGKGPYPSDAGEYCGNHQKGGRLDPIVRERMRFGRPHSCKAGTIAEMTTQGWVGLYLKEDDTNQLPGDVHVDTPDELREPPESGD